jgi:NAD(P)-dependent dehydrogenase (short-subunit alcohol dehydrogenase family)
MVIRCFVLVFFLLTEAKLVLDADQMVALVEHIEKDIGEIKVLVFNIGANVNYPILETTARVYRKVCISLISE